MEEQHQYDPDYSQGIQYNTTEVTPEHSSQDTASGGTEPSGNGTDAGSRKGNKETDRRGGLFLGGVLTGIICSALTISLVYTGIRVSQSRMEVVEEEPDPAESLEPLPSEEEIVQEDGILDKTTEYKIRAIEKAINKYYYKTDTDKEAARNYMYKGLVESLGDPYSTYYTTDEYKELMSDTEGIYSGIGAYVSKDTELKYPRITGIIKGTPAEEMKLMEGDIIYEVDGTSTYDMDLSVAVSMIKGEEGTVVHITILRDGVGEMPFDVVRRKVETPTVSTEMLEDGIGYLDLASFDMVSTSQFINGFVELQQQGMRGFILDLRGNPGGSLSVVCDIARCLLPEGLIVYTLDRDGNRTEYSCDGQYEIQIPMVVLVNGYSASASEILTGAIKDYKKGLVIGTTTYGKGVVQRIFDFDDETAVKLTISNYFTPLGNDINGVGIEPDIELEFDGEAYQNDGTDNQLERAIEEIKKQLD